MLSQYFVSAYTNLHMNRFEILYKSYIDPHIDFWHQHIQCEQYTSEVASRLTVSVVFSRPRAQRTKVMQG